MTQVEMTEKALELINTQTPDDVHSEDNVLRDVGNGVLALIALNLAAIADELKKERK